MTPLELPAPDGYAAWLTERSGARLGEARALVDELRTLSGAPAEQVLERWNALHTALGDVFSAASLFANVHPEEDGSSGPEVEFATSFPTHGTYRLFFDFKHGDEVRTADFTVDASGTPGGTSGETDEGAENPDDSHGGDDHGH